MHVLPFMLLLAMTNVPSVAKATDVHKTGCAFSFEYPKGGTVEEYAGCAIRISPPSISKSAPKPEVPQSCTVEIDPFESGFLGRAEDSGFDLVSGSWVLRGRHGTPGDAELSVKDGVMTLRGETYEGCFGENGGYQGLCAVSVALIGRGGDDFGVKVEAGVACQEIFELVVKSLTIEKSANEPPN